MLDTTRFPLAYARKDKLSVIHLPQELQEVPLTELRSRALDHLEPVFRSTRSQLVVPDGGDGAGDNDNNNDNSNDDDNHINDNNNDNNGAEQKYAGFVVVDERTLQDGSVFYCTLEPERQSHTQSHSQSHSRGHSQTQSPPAIGPENERQGRSTNPDRDQRAEDLARQIQSQGAGLSEQEQEVLSSQLQSGGCVQPVDPRYDTLRMFPEAVSPSPCVHLKAAFCRL